MDRDDLVKNYPEAKSLVNFVLGRYRKGVLNVVKIIGLSGTGKSYASLRFAEKLSEAIDGVNNITVDNTIDNLLDLIRFI